MVKSISRGGGRCKFSMADTVKMKKRDYLLHYVYYILKNFSSLGIKDDVCFNVCVLHVQYAYIMYNILIYFLVV
jgi:hypothetical protein